MARTNGPVPVAGGENLAVGNRITGLYHGIHTEGAGGQIVNNIVDGFSGDAMRALGDNSVVRGNKVQNCFQIDANHADGFQSYSRGPTGTPGVGTVYDLVVENNKIFEWTGSLDQCAQCRLQGSGCSDGMFDGVQIRNNAVAVTGYHGITVAGALNTVINQNTVVSAAGQGTTYPWIWVSRHKDGTPSRDVLIANNTSNAFKNLQSNPTATWWSGTILS